MRILLVLLMACQADKPDTARVRDTADRTLPPPEGPLLMIAETSTGRLLFHDTVADVRVGAQCLTELHPDDCARGTHDLSEPCLMFGAVAEVKDDEDVLTLSYTLRNPDLSYAPGVISQVQPSHPPSRLWTISQLSFSDALGMDCPEGNETPQCHLFGTHITLPTPSGALIVADTSNSRTLWVQPPEDGSTVGHVTAMLGVDHPQMSESWYVNHLQRIETDDAQWLLMTFKGQKGGGEGAINAGRIMLWDVTDSENPEHLWTYPGSGSLAAVHHASMHQTPLGPRLIYAHSLGHSEDAGDGRGAVGFAEWKGADPPEYLADGILEGDTELGFTRSAAYNTSEAAVLITDSGCENAEVPCGRSAKILLAELPDEAPAMLSGAWSEDHASQRFIPLTTSPIAAPDDLKLPFASQLLPLSDLGDPLSTEALGRCP